MGEIKLKKLPTKTYILLTENRFPWFAFAMETPGPKYVPLSTETCTAVLPGSPSHISMLMMSKFSLTTNPHAQLLSCRLGHGQNRV